MLALFLYYCLVCWCVGLLLRENFPVSKLECITGPFYFPFVIVVLMYQSFSPKVRRLFNYY